MMEKPVAVVPQKRQLEGDDEPAVMTPTKPIRSEASTPLSVLSPMQTPSPIKSTAMSSIAPDTASSHAVPSSSNAQPAKRRRLTEKEKDDQRLEKEAKARARADKKALKEAEEKLKAEEKRKKVEERDEKKRQKEEEQQQKEEEKAKKERAQLKLNAFFVKPKATTKDAGRLVVESTQNPATPPVSLLPEVAVRNTDLFPLSPQKAIVKNAQSDYQRYFLPFNIAAHVIMAPVNAFLDDPDKLKAAQTRLDALIAQEDICMEPITRETFKSTFRATGQRGLQTASIADVVECINGSSEQPIDLTSDSDGTPRQPLDMLKDITMKYLHFAKDVRPPYYGTYTKPYTRLDAARLARNPTARVRKDTDYDYDSEAEWDEPEEGEDLDSDGDSDGDSDAEDDMDGFLDDEEDPQVKRRLISGDLLPVSTGLCWEDTRKVSRLNDGSGAICTDFKDFTMGFLLEPNVQSIDPFSTSYWTPEAPPPVSVKPTNKEASTNSPMNPPRAPLAQRTMNGLLNTLNTPQPSSSASASKPAKSKRLIPTEQLPAFKAEIEGKDLTKIGMIEALKKVFPKFPKDAITNTLSVVAARVGPTEKEKRWVLINT